MPTDSLNTTGSRPRYSAAVVTSSTSDWPEV